MLQRPRRLGLRDNLGSAFGELFCGSVKVQQSRHQWERWSQIVRDRWVDQISTDNGVAGSGKIIPLDRERRPMTRTFGPKVMRRARGGCNDFAERQDPAAVACWCLILHQ